MHIAARRGHSDMIRVLMAAGADLTITNNVST